jgi:alpha-ribazole phosphatase
MYHLFLIRHGTTEAMENRVMQGITDSPLSPRGQEQALRASKALEHVPFKIAFSSPMVRALETASIIAKPHSSLKIASLDPLHEMDFGYYEGRPYFASPDEVPQGIRRLLLIAKVAFAQATGESLTSISRRAIKGWEQISEAIPGGEILIVSHAVLLNYLLKYLLSNDTFNSIKPVNLRPCSITELEVTSPGISKLVRFNDTAHLK